MLTIIASITALVALGMFVRNMFVRNTAASTVNLTIWAIDQAYLVLVFATIVALLNALKGQP